VAGFVYTHAPTAAYYLNHSDAVLAAHLGNYYFGGGEYDLRKAATSYELALQLDPATQLVRYQLARIYFVDGQLDRALAHINTELILFPYNPRSLYVRGLIYISVDNLSAAEEDFRNFVAWAPAEWGGYNDLAFVLAKEGKYAESEAVIMEAMQKVPDAKDIPWLWNSLGLAQLNRLHYIDAEASFTRALALSREVTPKQWRRAYSGNDPASIEASIKAFQAAIEANVSLAQAKK